MKRLIPIALAVVVVFALAAFTAPPAQQAQPAVVTPQQETKQAASCQRCGDGYCAPSCENELTCPKDCKSTKK